MADLKITALPALVEAGIQSTDVLALADLSATETKKVTVKDLVAAAAQFLDAGDIPAAKVGTLGTDQVATGAIQDGAVSNVKLANSSISLGGVSISLGATDATPAFNLADATGYTTANLSGTITNAQLAGSIAGTKLLDTTITYAKLNLSDGDIPGVKIAAGGITATQLAANSVTASELADDAVDTAAIADGAVVAASIATDAITANQIAANAIGASELADNAVDAGAIAADAVTTVKILNENVTAAKLAANLPGTILATGAIGSAQLAANSVTASELADNAVDSGAIAASAVVDAKIASGIGGAKITDGTITAAKLATANIDRSLNVASGNLGINNTVTAATRSGITYNAQGLITATVALAASDLPLATTSAVGAISVGTGLAVTGAGALSLSNSVTAATISGITYNAQGQITATTALVAGDLPAATTSAKGAVQVTSGGGISVDGSGAISTSTSGVTAGTYGKVTVDVKGVVTSGGNLIAGDIPDLSATKITSGTFDVGRFGTNTITGVKFADSSVCQFTGAQSTSGVVTFPTAEFKGQFFYDLTNDDLYVYDGSAFQPVTITSGEIIYAGNYRADTNKITSLTAAGTAQGFTQNAALQAASAANNRYYFVCDKSGTGTSPAPTVTINPPDMILSNGNTWEKLDISNFIAGQVASNIGVTATGGIQNTNVQSVLEELDTEKLNLTGGTLTGNLNLNQSSSIIFEGSTPDDFETTLTVIDPTADRTISLPNVSGTLVSSGDTGTVTSTMILDGTILNADINASAAIAFSKLAALTSAQILVGNGSNVPTAVAITGDISISNAGLVAISSGVIVDGDISGSAAISGSKIVAGTTSVVGVVQLTDSAASSSTTTAATPAAVKVAKDAADAAATTANAALPTTGGTLTNNLIIDNAKQIRFTEADANGANYVSLQAPDTLAADVSYTLPSAAPTANGQVLASTTAGVLSWTDDPTGQWITNGTNVYYDGGNVGIGTGNSPSEKLHIADGNLRLKSSNASGYKIKIGNVPADENDFLGGISGFWEDNEIATIGFRSGTDTTNKDDGMIFFGTSASGSNPSTHMTIRESGNIGIGTASPTGIHSLAKVLEISGGDGGDLIIGNNASSNIGAGAHIGAIAFKNIDSSTGSVPHYAGIRCESTDTAGNMDLRFYTGISNLEDDTPQVTMLGSNLGIGTTSPDQKLDVRDGDIILSSSNAANAHRTSFIQFTGSYARINSVMGQGSTSASNYAAGWNFTTRNYTGSAFETLTPLTIEANGNVGINNTSPTVKLAVDGGTTSDVTVLQVKNDSTSAYATTDGGFNTALSLYSDGTDAAQAVGIQFYLQKSGETGAISELGALRESSGNSSLVFRTRDSSSGVNERMRIDSSGRMGLGLTDPNNYYANQLVIKCPNEGGLTLRNTGADDWNYIMFASGTGGAARYSGWIGYDHDEHNMQVKVSDDDSGKGFRFRKDGDFEVENGSFRVTTGAGVVAHGPDNSTYGELTVEVAALDGSGSNNVATFKRGSNSVINLAFPSGGGIDFSATADSTGSNISMQGELLDDYERGTWGSINSGASSCTFSHNWYVKVGRLVTCNVRLSGITTTTGDALTLNLPFANGTVEAAGSIACDTFNMPNDWVLMNSYAYDGKLYVLASRDNAGWENLLGNMTANNTTIILNITYLANA